MFRNIFIKKCGWLTKEELQKKPGRLGRLQRGRQAVLDTREDSKQVRGQLELGVGGLFHTHLAVQQAGSGHTEWWANKQMFSDSKCHVTSALFTRVSVCWCTCVCRVCCDLTKQALCSQLGGLVSTCGFILNLKIWTFNDLLLAAFWTLYLVDAYWMHFGEVTPTPPSRRQSPGWDPRERLGGRIPTGTTAVTKVSFCSLSERLPVKRLPAVLVLPTLFFFWKRSHSLHLNKEIISLCEVREK